LNEWQVYMSELRRTALLHLTRDDQLRLFAMDPDTKREGDEEKRKELYASIRGHLPDHIRAKWDDRLDLEISFGLGHCGQSEIINHDIQEELALHKFNPIAKGGKRAALAKNPEFVECFQRVYGYENFKRRFAKLHITTAAMNEMIKRHLEVLARPNVEDNYFFRYYYTNYHIDKAQGLPLYLQEEPQEAIRQLGAGPSRLRFHIGDVISVASRLCQERSSAFDMISISNILDWVPENSAAEFVQSFHDLLKPGGMLVARHETKAKAYFPSLLSNLTGFTLDPEFNLHLHHTERSLLMRDTVAFIKLGGVVPSELC